MLLAAGLVPLVGVLGLCGTCCLVGTGIGFSSGLFLLVMSAATFPLMKSRSALLKYRKLLWRWEFSFLGETLRFTGQ